MDAKERIQTHDRTNSSQRPETCMNPNYKRSLDDCSAPPKLSFSDVLRSSGCAKATVSSRLCELALEQAVLHDGKGSMYTLNRTIEWLENEIAPPLRLVSPIGRPPSISSPQEDMRLIRKIMRLPPSECQFLRSKGVSMTLHHNGRPDFTIASLPGTNGPTAPANIAIKDVLGKQRKEADLLRVIERENRRLGRKRAHQELE
jgi:hypothetical protein